MKDLQTEYSRGNTRINLRKAIQEAHGDEVVKNILKVIEKQVIQY